MSDWFDQPVNRIRAFLEYLDDGLPGTAMIFFSDDATGFAAGVEKAIHTVVDDLERNRAAHVHSDERALSTTFVDRLKMAAIPCTAEAYTNGHVDISIEHPRKRTLRYLGECKIWGGAARHRSGCEQLLQRYSTGREVRGFVLDFFKKAEMFKKLRALRASFTRDKPLCMTGGPSEHHFIEGGFTTTHSHSNGAELCILHLGCDLCHLERPSE